MIDKQPALAGSENASDPSAQGAGTQGQTHKRTHAARADR